MHHSLIAMFLCCFFLSTVYIIKQLNTASLDSINKINHINKASFKQSTFNCCSTSSHVMIPPRRHWLASFRPSRSPTS
ncbi:hypothetical protein V8C35DRAFT_295818 [Trichoderma chlorosporum]